MRKATAVLTAVMVSVWVTGERSASAQTDSLRAVKPTSLSFHLATLTPTRGFEAQTLAGNGTIYVASEAVLSGSEVVSAEAIEARNGSDVVLSVTNEAARRLRAVMGQSGVDQLAIFSNGALLAAGRLSIGPNDGGVVVSGLSTVQADRVVRLVNGDSIVSLGAVLSLAPAQSRIQPGGAVTVDIFVSGVSDLRTYQATLGVSGGESGVMVLEDLGIDTGRPDYVFGTLQSIQAADLSGSRAAGVLFHGGVDATRPSYLGTATLRASTDAAGTFQISVQTADQSSLLWNSANQPIMFATRTIAISVGKSSRVRPIPAPRE